VVIWARITPAMGQTTEPDISSTMLTSSIRRLSDT